MTKSGRIIGLHLLGILQQTSFFVVSAAPMWIEEKQQLKIPFVVIVVRFQTILGHVPLL